MQRGKTGISAKGLVALGIASSVTEIDQVQGPEQTVRRALGRQLRAERLDDGKVW